MANVATSWVQVEPSYVLPEVLLSYAQASSAFDLIAEGGPMVRLSEGDLYAYIKKFDVRTKVQTGQTPGNQLPSATLTASMISTPSYLIRTRAEYDHHDTAALSKWGIPIAEAQRLAMRQGTFQQLRGALLYGINPANGEGLLNTTGATTISLPADSNGNTTLVTYDNGQLAVFFLTLISSLKTRTMQLGTGQRISIVGPQRCLGAMEYQDIVQLTQFQRVGGGTETSAGVVKNILDLNGDILEWGYDDTLIGKGAGGTDAIVISMPEIKKNKAHKINTNEFANLAPGLEATALMLCDMAAPKEIPTPLPGGAIDVVSELRSTSGWGLRGEAVTILSMQYQ